MTVGVQVGLTQIDVDVYLIQGTHSERLQHLHLTEMLSRFHPGPARLRAVATGREQWTRVPPPTVRVIEVEIK